MHPDPIADYLEEATRRVWFVIKMLAIFPAIVWLVFCLFAAAPAVALIMLVDPPEPEKKQP